MKKILLHGLLLGFLLNPELSIARENLSYKGQYGFIENKGQVVDQYGKVNNAVKYLLNTPGLNVHLRSDGFSYDTYVLTTSNADKNTTYRFHRVDITFEGANTNAKIITEKQAADYINYYLAGKEALNVHHSATVIYKDIYKGIDLEFTTDAKGKAVEYNFIVHPGADASQIRMRYNGADNTALANGNINIAVTHGTLQETIPASFIESTHVPVSVKYRQVAGNIFQYDVASYDKSKTLIIDPTPDVPWATYYGDNAPDEAAQVVVQGASVFMTGNTMSGVNIATTGSYQSTISQGTDIFLANISTSGVRSWATYYGSTGSEYAYSIAKDANGNLIICGHTTSGTGFTSSSAHQTTLNGTNDAFLVLFNNAGQRQWCTYFGGTDTERGYDVAVDGNNNIYMAGTTASMIGMASTGTQQDMYGGGLSDGYLVKFNSSGTFQWSTYAGDMDKDEAFSVATDGSGNVFLAGVTYAPVNNNLVSSGSHQESFGGDSTDYFIGKYNSSDGTRQWGTYYGGMAGEVVEPGKKLATDATGNLYFVGSTLSADTIATLGAFQIALNNSSKDGFIAKFNGSGVRQWGTYYGSANDDAITGVAVSAAGEVYTIGYSNSTNGLATTGSYQAASGGNLDVFISKFSTTGIRAWASYFGGGDIEAGNGIALDGSRIYIAGRTGSNNGVATSNGHQAAYGGGSSDAFLARINSCNGATITSTSTITGAGCFGQSNGSIVVNANGGQVPYQYKINTATGFQASNMYSGLPAGNYTIEIKDDNSCVATRFDTVTQFPQVQQPVISGSTTAGSFTTHTYTETANTPISNYTYSWVPTPGIGLVLSTTGNSASVIWGNTAPATLNVVVCTGGGTCCDTGSMSVNIVPSSVDDVTGEANVAVYPNPAKDMLTVKLQALPADIKELQLFDNSGKLIMSQPLQKEQTLNISTLPAGNYHLNIGGWQKQISKF